MNSAFNDTKLDLSEENGRRQNMVLLLKFLECIDKNLLSLQKKKSCTIEDWEKGSFWYIQEWIPTAHRKASNQDRNRRIEVTVVKKLL